ncbi:haloacid dehalogenase [Acrocarpospora phusangensis]|uniref:Haloacid dehalogenase n=1 Tax=Acrocarpospora phusangensis TaxID=1070424 RepID=A0A919QH85_9ACTN|nr:HAD-IA family hydrolase [Acrocarpospora phusangensis]GIH27846.1 haloacid dehalogenase [Acrocarpospora phusangensis]
MSSVSAHPAGGTDSRALIFDFDGVIVDTESAVVAGWRAECVDLGVPFDEEAFVATLGTPSLRPERVAAVLGAAGGDPLAAIDRIRSRVRALALDLPVLPGVRELLEQARAAGVRTAVASSANREWVTGHLERVGLLSAFAAVFCRDDVAAGKPAPDLYLAALASLRSPAPAAVAIEDTATGVTAAQAAGLRCVAVPGPLTIGHDLAVADLILPSLAGVGLDDLFALHLRAGTL